MVKGRMVRGAALLATLVRQIQTDVLDGYGIPWGEYAPSMYRFDETRVEVRFEHRDSGRILRVTNIWCGWDGEILQCGSNYGDLSL